MNDKWIEWEKERGKKVLNNTTFKNNRTFISYTTEILDK